MTENQVEYAICEGCPLLDDFTENGKRYLECTDDNDCLIEIITYQGREVVVSKDCMLKQIETYYEKEPFKPKRVIIEK